MEAKGLCAECVRMGVGKQLARPLSSARRRKQASLAWTGCVRYLTALSFLGK
jgi:hypothetical protein